MTELSLEEKERRKIAREIKSRPKRFGTKIRNHMKREGLRSGQLQLEYWKKPDPSPSSLAKINLTQKVIIEVIEEEILKYTHAL